MNDKSHSKKVKECSSPARGDILHKTPIRTTSTHNTQTPSAYVKSPIFNDEEEEKRKNREELLKKKHENLNSLMSPSAEASPRAEPPSSILSAKGKSSSLLNLTNSASNSIESFHSQSPLSIRNHSQLSKSISGSKLNNNSNHTISGPKRHLSTKTPQSVEEMSKSFEEWMKMAADNKINSKNSWNFALIDYFSELTFLKEGDSINFQKASCTLDGCVKIYSSRVDSVVDETTKLLNGLSDKKYSQTNENEQDATEVGEEEGNGKLTAAHKNTKRSSSRSIETIEKNPENLTLKNFELEFSIDPLFKKTSAEFDESGTRGSLLKTLQISPIDNLIIFDSSDQIPMDFNQNFNAVNNETDNEDDLIDISDFKHLNISIDSLGEKLISPTFENYNLSTSTSLQLTNEVLLEKLSNLPKFDRIPENKLTISSNTATNNNNVYDNNMFMDMDMGGFDEDNYNDEDFVEEDADVDVDTYGNLYDEGFGEEAEAEGKPVERVRDKEARRSSAMINLRWNHQDGDVSGLSYFDGAFKETWAGPEHWKIRRSQRTASTGNNASIITNSITTTARKASKQEKKAAIDFMTTIVDFRQIFSKPTTASQITLTKAAILERNEQNHLLPEDLHFTSSKLLKLFIKPTWTITSTRERSIETETKNDEDNDVVISERRNTIVDDFVDKNYWLSQETKSNGIKDQDENGSTVIDHDNHYDAGMDDYYDDIDIPMNPITNNNSAVDPLEIDFNKQMVAAPKFILAPQLNYARVAKRVDIAKLKATLWQEFLENNLNEKNNNNNIATQDVMITEDPEEESIQSNTSASTNTFSNLINNLSKSYPTDALADLSVPYCFICLLHLANENNLEIKETDSDLIILN